MQDFKLEQLARRPLMPAGQHPKTSPQWGLERADGRQVFLDELTQYYIYRGHLLGMMLDPSKPITEAIQYACKQHSWVGSEPVVLPPVLLEYDLKHIHPLFAPIEGAPPPVTLPRVASIAHLLSNREARDHHESFSSLVVIWFQEGFGNPDGDILQQIAALDWDALAYDWTP